LCDFSSSSSSSSLRIPRATIDRSRAFDHKPTSLFLNEVFPAKIQKPLSAFARARVLFSAAVVLTDSLLSGMFVYVYMYHRRPVPAPSHGRLQILRATRRRLQVKKKGVPFGVSERKQKKQERETRLSFVRRLEMHKIREREREREREKHL